MPPAQRRQVQGCLLAPYARLHLSPLPLSLASPQFVAMIQRDFGKDIFRGGSAGQVGRGIPCGNSGRSDFAYWRQLSRWRPPSALRPSPVVPASNASRTSSSPARPTPDIPAGPSSSASPAALPTSAAWRWSTIEVVAASPIAMSTAACTAPARKPGQASLRTSASRQRPRRLQAPALPAAAPADRIRRRPLRLPRRNKRRRGRPTTIAALPRRAGRRSSCRPSSVKPQQCSKRLPVNRKQKPGNKPIAACRRQDLHHRPRRPLWRSRRHRRQPHPRQDRQPEARLR